MKENLEFEILYFFQLNQKKLLCEHDWNFRINLINYTHDYTEQRTFS